MPVTLTDAERTFADSPAGRAKLAYERNKFDMRNAHLGDRAPKWTDAMEANLVRDVMTRSARSNVETAAYLADAERKAPVLRAQAETARAQMIDGLRNGWKGGK